MPPEAMKRRKHIVFQKSRQMSRQYWKSPCGRVVIMEHSPEAFELFFDGKSVMPPRSFERVCRYVWLEFLEADSEGEPE